MNIAGSIGVCAIALGFIGLLPAQAMSAETARHDLSVQAGALAGPRVIFGEMHTTSNPRTLEPCWFVRNDIYRQALANGNLRVRITLRYLSGGEHVRRTLTVAIRDALIAGDSTIADSPSDPSQYTHLIYSWDAGANGVPDAGTTFKHTIRLYDANRDHDDDGDDDGDDS